MSFSSGTLQGKTCSIAAGCRRSYDFFISLVLFGFNDVDLMLGMSSAGNLEDLMNSLLAEAWASPRQFPPRVPAPSVALYPHTSGDKSKFL